MYFIITTGSTVVDYRSLGVHNCVACDGVLMMQFVCMALCQC